MGLLGEVLNSIFLLISTAFWIGAVLGFFIGAGIFLFLHLLTYNAPVIPVYGAGQTFERGAMQYTVLDPRIYDGSSGGGKILNFTARFEYAGSGQTFRNCQWFRISDRAGNSIGRILRYSDTWLKGGETGDSHCSFAIPADDAQRIYSIDYTDGSQTVARIEVGNATG